MFPHLLQVVILTLTCLHFTAAGAPTVSLPYGTFQGFTDGNLTKFLGVPFAQAARFETPKPPGLLQGVQNATSFGPACPQQKLTALPIPFPVSTYPSISEDCLTLDIFKPLGAESTSKLPVFVWIYGGGFEVGNSRDTDMSPMVKRSIETGEPVLIVTPNYRLSAFGFLAGKEVGAAGISNLGLRDQIFALQWVQKHISAFGGDPTRVVIGGLSAGSISAAFLTLSNKQNSNALFHGVINHSGGVFYVPRPADSQSNYDALVAANNCSASSNTLECLRHVPFESIMATLNVTEDFFSYGSLAIPWRPSIDGDVVEHDPFISTSRGLYAKIPVITGISDDEGTLFSLSTLNITTDAEFLDYVHSNYLPASSQDQIAQIGHLYPDDPTQGSPFDTGTAYQLSPEYKRMAAFQGDFGIIAPRRFFLEHAAFTQNTWSYVNKRGKDTPLGAAHGSDTSMWFFINQTETVAVDAMINFVNTLDPNRPAKGSNANLSIFWPKWNTPSTSGSSSLLTFTDSGINITAENFRVEAIGFLNDLFLEEASGK